MNSIENNKKLYLESQIQVEEETDDLKKMVASIIDLPTGKDKQPDLLYFTAIFVSSGANLNNAYFQPSELVKAEHTIKNKALDIEHKEEDIVGHIYDRAFIGKDGSTLSLKELSALDSDAVDKSDMHVVIAGIVYKDRFPELAKEISEGKWKVSMETFYGGYDIKIGDLILNKNDAESLGLVTSSSIGKLAKVLRNKIEIAEGKVTRVLRDLIFSGCGFVKNPANPPSVVLETANKNLSNNKDDFSIIVLDYDKLNKDVADVVDNDIDIDAVIKKNIEESELQHNDTVGICVSYKKEVIAEAVKNEDSKVTHTNWCALFDASCTSSSRDTTDPKCLRTVALTTASDFAKKLVAKKIDNDKRQDLLERLSNSLKKV